MEEASDPVYSTYYDYDLVFGNDTYPDYTRIGYPGEIKKVPLYEIILKSYLYAMIIFFSLVGNSLIIVVVLRHKRMRTTTNYYIVNLAVADILVTVFCTWVHLVNNLNNNNWVLGSFFCKFNTFSQVLCLVASVLSLTLIAYDRFFGIVFALKAHMTSRKARTAIVLIWLVSFILAAPLLWYRELKEREWRDHTERWCDGTWPVVKEWDSVRNTTVTTMPTRTVYFTFVSVMLYFFPMLTMAIAYSVIILKLRLSTVPGERINAGMTTQQKTKRKVIAMLITIMSVFGVCWLPYQIVLLYSELRPNRETLGDWYFLMQFLAGCFAYSNSALNPLIYAGFNENFKQALMIMKSDMDSSAAYRRYSRAGSIQLNYIKSIITNNRRTSRCTITTMSTSPKRAKFANNIRLPNIKSASPNMECDTRRLCLQMNTLMDEAPQLDRRNSEGLTKPLLLNYKYDDQISIRRSQSKKEYFKYDTRLHPSRRHSFNENVFLKDISLI